MTIIASGTVSRIDLRWASRASASCAACAARYAAALQQLAADQAMPTPSSTKVTASMISAGRQVVYGAMTQEHRRAGRATVASSPGPSPPTPAATRTAGHQEQVERLA